MFLSARASGSAPRLYSTLFNDTFDCDYTLPGGNRYKDLMHRTSLGIFCLTEDPDSHVMWVHYAAQHTGFVLGFDTSSELFSENGAKLAAVDYMRGSPGTPLKVATPV